MSGNLLESSAFFELFGEPLKPFAIHRPIFLLTGLLHDILEAAPSRDNPATNKVFHNVERDRTPIDHQPERLKSKCKDLSGLFGFGSRRDQLGCLYSRWQR